MTLSVFQTGNQDVTSPGEWQLVYVTGPAVYAALVNPMNQDGVELRVSWRTSFGGETDMWVDHRTVDVDSVDVAVGILSPPVPIGVSGSLHLEVIAGTLGSNTIAWTVYKL